MVRSLAGRHGDSLGQLRESGVFEALTQAEYVTVEGFPER